MIYSFIHPGSGLGNQLFRIVAGKVLALDKGYQYSAVGREHFKGNSFMNIDFGLPESIPYKVEMPAGKIIRLDKEDILWEENTPYYNPEFNFIEDNTIIDGEFQDPRYFGHRMDEISEWLKVEQTGMLYNTCIIGFRGGEFSIFPDLFLTKEYWEEAIKLTKEDFAKNDKGELAFEVHTDDEVLAKEFFPDFKIIHDIGINWRSMRYAKYAIIANSSFYILPRLLAHHNTWLTAKTIAPRYWARRNIKEWSMPQNYYKCFTYL